MELKSVADLVCDLVKPAEIAAHSTPLATPKAAPALGLSPISRNSNGQPLAVPEADDFWRTLRARIDECDALIHQLCDARDDDDEHRAALLAVRKRMAPEKLKSDIVYLKAQIAALKLVTPKQTRGRCIECEHFARVGVGERRSHPDPSPSGEPQRAQCLPPHQCGLFNHWRPPQPKNSTL